MDILERAIYDPCSQTIKIIVDNKNYIINEEELAKTIIDRSLWIQDILNKNPQVKIIIEEKK